MASSVGTAEPLKVAVIGGGPSAMFFAHAWNQQKEILEQRRREVFGGENHNYNTTSEPLLFRDLQITCFEKAGTPGGVWRAEETPEEEDMWESSSSFSSSSTIYDELWTNSPAHCIEFYDYTFEDHFGADPIPMFLPRRDVNEYLMERVTQRDPSFFDHYFQFHSQVVSVEEEEGDGGSATKGPLRVTVQDTRTGELSEGRFDKVIWAAGQNAKGVVPPSLQALFRPQTGEAADVPTGEEPTGAASGGESGNNATGFLLLHSTETDRLRSSVAGKRVLLVGGSYSSEDLALQCLKWGASHIDVAARDDDSVVTWTMRWPGDRVRVHLETAIRSVEDDGSIVLEKGDFQWPRNFMWVSELDEEEQARLHRVWQTNETTTVLEGIDIVVFCTGYRPDLSMLGDSLRPVADELPDWLMGMHESMFLDAASGSNFSWGNWTMDSNNKAHEYVGDIPVAQKRMIRVNYNHPEMHRGILLKNPNLMFLADAAAFLPMPYLDVHAWLLCSYLTGLVPMPSVEELTEANRRQILYDMNMPHVRRLSDEKYFEAIKKLIDVFEEEDDTKIPYYTFDYEQEHSDPSEADDEVYYRYTFELLARSMLEGNYPGPSWATAEGQDGLILNDIGETMMQYMMASYNTRFRLNRYEEGVEWRTFRDETTGIETVRSIFTETQARPLKTRWMDISGLGRSVKDGGI